MIWINTPYAEACYLSKYKIYNLVKETEQRIHGMTRIKITFDISWCHIGRKSVVMLWIGADLLGFYLG